MAQDIRKNALCYNGAFICFTESDGLSLAKAAKLPLLVENEVKKISDMRKELKKEEGRYKKLLLDYQKVFLVISSFLLNTMTFQQYLSSCSS